MKATHHYFSPLSLSLFLIVGILFEYLASSCYNYIATKYLFFCCRELLNGSWNGVCRDLVRLYAANTYFCTLSSPIVLLLCFRWRIFEWSVTCEGHCCHRTQSQARSVCTQCLVWLKCHYVFPCAVFCCVKDCDKSFIWHGPWHLVSN